MITVHSLSKKDLEKLEHKERHELLHKHFDELLADFIGHTRKLPSKTTIFELLQWSNKQTENPT